MKLTQPVFPIATAAFFFALLPTLHAASPLQPITTQPAAAPTLEDAYRALHKGLSAPTKEEKLKALDAFLPTKKDIEVLFPKDVDKLWPGLEQQNKRMRENIDQFAAEITNGGPITEIRVTDVRKTPSQADGKFKAILAIIPKDVGLANLVVVRDSVSSGSSGYVFVNNHWFQIRGLHEFPEFLIPK